MVLYKRLWPYIKRYLKWTVLAILCTAVVSGTNGLTAWLIKPVINEIFISKDTSLLKLLPLAVAGVFIVRGIFTYFQSYLMQYATLNAVKDIRDDLYAQMIYLPVTEYNRTTTGNLISRVINDVGLVSRLSASVVKDLVQQAFTIIGLSVVLFMDDWRLALISIVIFPFAGIFIAKYGRKAKGITRKAQASMASIVSIMQECFTGIRIVKTFTTEDLEKKRFLDENRKMTALIIRTAKVSSRVAPTMDMLAGLAVGAIIFYGGNQVVSGSMTPGDFFSFTAALLMLYGPVKTLGNLHNTIQQGMAALERVFEVMDKETERPKMESGISEFAGLREGIEYRGVGFRYDGKQDEVLKDINFAIKKGEVVALVGSSGSGKTTIANLLPRFYEIAKGAILIDGVDIRQYNLTTLRRHIAMVTQDTILFDDTIRNNIAYGKDTYTEEQVLAAARAAHADKFAGALPAGYDTMVGEKGVRLSGGEKQRIAIARAILKDSPILVLDEATSSLDTESERIVQEALENLMKNRTTLVIAHRLSTVINADKIVVINNGSVADIGRHSELLVKSPIYKRLYEMQFGHAEGEHVEAR